MIEIYQTSETSAHEKLLSVLSRHIPAPFEISVTENGKPYIAGDPVYFSLSHSDGRAVIAVSSLPAGIDLEVFKGRVHTKVFSRFPEAEQAEIADESDFLMHWTAREAFVKLRGGQLATMWKHIEFSGGKLRFCGETQRVKLRFYKFYYGIAALCTEMI